MPAELWAWQGGTVEWDFLGSARFGENGTSAFAGHTSGNWSGINAGGLDWAAVKLTAEGEEMWRTQGGTAVDEQVFDLALDEDGSIFLVGTTDNEISAADFLVIKLDPLGNELWMLEKSTDGQDTARAIELAQDGGIIVAGHTSGVWNASSAGLWDFAAFRLDADGTEVWRYQDGTDGDDWFYGMAIADDNTVVLVGHTAGDFGAVNPGSHDVVAIKLNATDGREIWRYQDGTVGAERFNKASFFGDDNSIVLAGMTQGDWASTGKGEEDFAVVALDSSGAFIWGWQDGTTERDIFYGAATTEDSCVILTGSTEGSWSGPSVGDEDFAAVKLCDGEEIWRYQGGTAGQDISWCSAVGSDGKLVLSGFTSGSWAKGSSLGENDFLVVMVNTTAAGVSDAASVPVAAVSSQDTSTAMVGGLVAVAAGLCIAFAGVVLKRRRDKNKHTAFAAARDDFHQGAVSREQKQAAVGPQLGPPHLLGGCFSSCCAKSGRTVAAGAAVQAMPRSRQIRREGVGVPSAGVLVTHNADGGDGSSLQELAKIERKTSAHLSRTESATVLGDDSTRGNDKHTVMSGPARNASGFQTPERRSSSAEGGLKQPFDGVGIALSVVEGALMLAENCPIPGVCEAAHLVSVLVNMAADSRGGGNAGEARIKMCRSVLMTLQRAADVLGKGENTHGEAERVMIEDVHDAVADLVELIKTYESKNTMAKVFASTLFKRRQEEADAMIDRAILRLHLGLQVQVGNKLHQVGEDVKKGMQGRPKVPEEPSSSVLADKRRARRQRKLEQLEIPEDHVTITKELLGRGGFGAVFLASYNYRNAAAKVIQINHELGRMGSLDENDPNDAVRVDRSKTKREIRQRKAFLREMNAMIRLRSPHTVNVYGAITSRKDRLVLVMELLAGGDLRTFLRGSREPLPEERIRRIIADVCMGMVFLHSKATVHGDLKSANVLLDGAGRAKIGDFGTSRWTHRGGDDTTGLATYTQRTKPTTPMSLAWSAPEVLEAEGCTHESDVYSFGVVVWEVLSREVPWASKDRPRDIICAVLKGLRPLIPRGAPTDMAAMARACWSGVPAERPTFESVMESIKSDGKLELV